MYTIIAKYSGDLYLFCMETGGIPVESSPEPVLDRLEDMALEAGLTPEEQKTVLYSVVEVESLEWVFEHVIGYRMPPPQPITIDFGFGTMTGVRCSAEEAEEIWEKGMKPEIM